jgi:hypothetical protein
MTFPVCLSLECQQVSGSHNQSGEHKLDNIQVISDLIWCLRHAFGRFILEYWSVSPLFQLHNKPFENEIHIYELMSNSH